MEVLKIIQHLIYKVSFIHHKQYTLKLKGKKNIDLSI